MAKRARTVKAVTFHDVDVDQANGDANMPVEHFNYGKWQAGMPPRYEPHIGDHHFRYLGRYFQIWRQEKQAQLSIWRDCDEETLQISCVGLSTKPIKDLLLMIKAWDVEQRVSKTCIRHATAKFGGKGLKWSQLKYRPSRPISSVILDENKKQEVIDDIGEFLHPQSGAKWYATRGIPYRRGYLFHGPPGTGKTSLSCALAGLFGLDLFCLSLNDPEMSETDLMELFNALPRRCIVLIEDIDEAGIKRSEKTETSKKIKNGKDKDHRRHDSVLQSEQHSRTTSATPQSQPVAIDPAAASPAETQWTLQDLARAIMSVSQEHQSPRGRHRSTSFSSNSSDSESDSDDDHRRRRRGQNNDPRSKGKDDKKKKKSNGISLSGLLNAIDGVASPEGRVLIMTTNAPDALDAALIRPGRVDMRTRFGHASEQQIRELYMRMYALDDGGVSRLGALDLFAGQDISMDEATQVLQVKAKEFAGLVPQGERAFSPSSIQGYLLLHKKTPGRAVKEAAEWIQEEEKRIAEKKEREKTGNTGIETV